MNTDLSIISLILDASFVVQLVMIILLIASILSWVVIFEKNKFLNDVSNDSKSFERLFWSGKELETIYKSYEDKNNSELFSSSAIFKSGYEEFSRLYSQKKITTDQMLLSVNRSMRVSHIKLSDNLEKNLAFLATVGSTSPYIGLFGTVWGIMNSFIEIAKQQNTNLAVVAPGIAEALLATGLGLLAAIPAVIFYNKLSFDSERIITGYENFSDEFSTILSRQLDS